MGKASVRRNHTTVQCRPVVLICLVFGKVLLTDGVDMALDLPISVGARGGESGKFPVSVVVPLPRGHLSDPVQLGLAETPSQVEVLERWTEDKSLRHVQVHFQTDVSASATYHLRETPATTPEMAVRVRETSKRVTVETGKIRFHVSKRNFNIIDALWVADSSGEYNEQIINNGKRQGGVFKRGGGDDGPQYDAARKDISVVVEETGPMRAVIRVDAPARYTDLTDHLHGFAVRLYAFAGLPFLKVDYQLQNSDHTRVRSYPLRFQDLTLDFKLKGKFPHTSIGTVDGRVYDSRDAPNQKASPIVLKHHWHNAYSVYDRKDRAIAERTEVSYDEISKGTSFFHLRKASGSTAGLTVIGRNFWQQWPNGLALRGKKVVSVELFPTWSAQWIRPEFNDDGEILQESQLHPSGDYWLDDMQHVYKEMVLVFHPSVDGTSGEELTQLAKTFQYPPVPTLPTSWYRTTKATLSLGGYIPTGVEVDPLDTVSPDAYSDSYMSFDPNNRWTYKFSWQTFGDPEGGGRENACEHGGWPYSSASFLITGHSSDYYVAETYGIGEMNLRPQWLSLQYSYDSAGEIDLQLTENPYCGGTWRVFEGHGVSVYDRTPPDFISLSPNYFARDDQHAWFYHVAESYFITGNPWVRDWYQFVGQFRRVRLHEEDPFPDHSSRGIGHALNHALQAVRITGDDELLSLVGSYLRTILRPNQHPRYGVQLTSVESPYSIEVSGGGYQTGYLAKSIIDYLLLATRIVDAQAYAEAFNYLSGLMEWNLNYGNFPYYFNAEAEGGVGTSSGTSLTLVDAQSWYYYNTGKIEFWNHVVDYLDGGIGDGSAPYGEWGSWRGSYEGRVYNFVLEQAPLTGNAPDAIVDLTATAMGTSQVRLQWTAPSFGSTENRSNGNHYHVVWCDKFIVEEQSTDEGLCNWWAANAVGTDLVPKNPGQQETLTVDVFSGDGTVYVAVFSFGNAGRMMSAISNIAEAFLS